MHNQIWIVEGLCSDTRLGWAVFLFFFFELRTMLTVSPFLWLRKLTRKRNFFTSGYEDVFWCLWLQAQAIFNDFVMCFSVALSTKWWSYFIQLPLLDWVREPWHNRACCWCQHDGICKYGADCIWGSLQVTSSYIHCGRTWGGSCCFCKPWCLHGLTTRQNESHW